jgi:hypothetical protein
MNADWECPNYCYNFSPRILMAHPDLNALLDTLLPFTQKMLSEHGGFHPWGAIMSSGGEIQWVGADLGEEFPPGQLVIDTLTETFKEQAASGQIRAVGICYDVLTVPPGENRKTDAICCRLEHYLGESLDVFIPYTKTTGDNIVYGDIFTTTSTASVFCNLPSC